MFELFYINVLHETFAGIFYNCNRPLVCTGVRLSGNTVHMKCMWMNLTKLW